MLIHVVYYEFGEYADKAVSVAALFSSEDKAKEFVNLKNEELIENGRHYSVCRFDGSSYEYGSSYELDNPQG